VHAVLFGGLVRAIAERAERATAQDGADASPLEANS
jgi:hypothetical protein